MLKTRPHIIFGPFFGTKRWITFERKKISKIANKVLAKRHRRGSVPNFKTRALAVWKLKGKENCENEHRETASFMYNFVQKTNATVQVWWHFIPTSPLNFFTRFLPEDPFKRKFMKRPKSDFLQKSNFWPYSDALTLSKPGFFWAPKTKGGGGGHIVPPPCKNPVTLLRIHSSKLFLKACPKMNLLTQLWFPWKPWLGF